MGHFISDTTKWWDSLRIPYTDKGTPAAMSNNIATAVAAWNAVNSVKWEEKADADTDFIAFAEGTGCSSHVGRKGGKQTVTCTGSSVRSLLHEMSHAAGIFHEHCRPDRNQHVGVNLDNVIQAPDDKRHNFMIDDGSSTFGAYDFASIMHYRRDTFAYDDREPTIYIPSTAPVGVANFSPTDLATLAFMYSGWQMDFPAELAGEPALRFINGPAVFATELRKREKSIYVLTTTGRLAQIWDNDPGGPGWHIDFPAEIAGLPDLVFQGIPAVFPTNAERNEKSIYVLTADGRLAQIWDNIPAGSRWQIDFPAERAGQDALRFAGSVAVFARDSARNKKSIYAVTTDGQLAQIWDDNPGGPGWHLDFPAVSAGALHERFLPTPAVFPTNLAGNEKSIYAITATGRLAQIWDNGPGGPGWHMDFPAVSAGQPDLQFQAPAAVFPTNAPMNKKSIYLLMQDGECVQLWDNPVANGWNFDLPVAAAGQPDMRFSGGPVVFPTDAAKNEKSIYLIANDGRLLQAWDNVPGGPGWHHDFPGELTGNPLLRFTGRPAVLAFDGRSNKKLIYALTADGRLAQIWDR